MNASSMIADKGFLFNRLCEEVNVKNKHEAYFH